MNCVGQDDYSVQERFFRQYYNAFREELNEPYLREGIITEGGNYADIIVPQGYVFVMGDNRPHSTDSRSFGCIPIDKIESRVAFRFWPLNKIGVIK